MGSIGDGVDRSRRSDSVVGYFGNYGSDQLKVAARSRYLEGLRGMTWCLQFKHCSKLFEDDGEFNLSKLFMSIVTIRNTFQNEKSH